MFDSHLNRSLGENIEKLIDKSFEANKFDCEIKLEELAKSNASTEIFVSRIRKIETEYLETVLDDLVDELKIFSDKIYTRFLLAFNSSISGYNVKNDRFSLGLIYALIYYAYTSKKADTSKCEMLNQHFESRFVKIMNDLAKNKKIVF